MQAKIYGRARPLASILQILQGQPGASTEQESTSLTSVAAHWRLIHELIHKHMTALDARHEPPTHHPWPTPHQVASSCRQLQPSPSIIVACIHRAASVQQGDHRILITPRTRLRQSRHSSDKRTESQYQKCLVSVLKPRSLIEESDHRDVVSSDHSSTHTSGSGLACSIVRGVHAVDVAVHA